MSTKKITALTELAAAAAAADMIPIVDVSDTTDAATGTTKKITALNVGKGIGIGAGNTTAEPVKIDTSNARLGVGTDAPSQLVHIKNSSGSATVMIETPNNGSDATLSMKSSDNQWNINSLEGGDLSIHDAGTAERMRIDTNGQVGIGTDSPSTALHLHGADADFQITAADGSLAFKAGQDADGDGSCSVYNSVGNPRAVFDADGDSYVKGNFGVGQTTFGTNSVSVFAIANGTIPASSPADAVQLYAQDVSTSELKVRDEAGNLTTLSPHNFDMLGDRSEDMAWSYSSKNVFIGKEIAVDMTKVIRALEKLTGEEYIKIRDIAKSEKLDWATEEKKKEDLRKAEIASLKEEGLPQPDAYKKKSKPAWIK